MSKSKRLYWGNTDVKLPEMDLIAIQKESYQWFLDEGIKITFDSGLLFDVDQSELQPAAKTNIESLAKTLNKYPDTNILVEGDTDNSGSDAYNLQLSERRAQAVANYLKGLGVAGQRISTVGLGETNQIASNDTEYGRQQNRRVEVAIFANEKLKKAAENGKFN